MKESSIHQHFGQLIDPRIDRTKKHPLINIIFIAFCAVLCGAEDSGPSYLTLLVTQQQCCGAVYFFNDQSDRYSFVQNLANLYIFSGTGVCRHCLKKIVSSSLWNDKFA